MKARRGRTQAREPKRDLAFRTKAAGMRLASLLDDCHTSTPK